MSASSVRKYSNFVVNTAVALPFIFAPLWAALSPANAAGEQFDAGKVMNEMTAQERISYIAGVVEGLAIARYMKDGKEKAGMECIYDWFYDDKTTLRTIHDAFDKYPTYPPGSIMDVLAKKKCGE